MAQLKDWQSGTSNDPYVVGSSGSLTLNQGTANGVAYLNGSKVVTSGSALTFNGTNFGVGVSPALARLHTSTNLATTADFTGSVRVTNESYTAGTYAGILFETADTLNSYVTGIRQSSYAGALAFGVNTGSNGTSLSEQMRLTSTGLGIGTSSPSYKLDVQSGTATIQIRSSTTSSGAIPKLRFEHAGNDSFSIVGGSYMAWLSSDSTERMRLDASGNLLLGSTSSPSTIWSGSRTFSYVKGNTAGNGGEVIVESNNGNQQASFFASAITAEFGLWSTKASALLFGNNNAERARIDTSGNLLIGTTSTSSSSGTGFKVLANLGVSGHFDPSVVTPSNNTSQSCWDIYSTGAGAYRFYVTSSGVVNAVSTTITAISDQRLKENIRDIDTGLDSVLSLKPRRFDWKNGKGQDKKNAAGFIAQEFETVFPDSVGTSKAGEDGVEYKNICHEELIPTLVKAIQEMKSIIDDQAARIATLEAK
jgi:hypothetical protein